MTRPAAMNVASQYFDGGAFFADLAALVAVRTESRTAERRLALRSYLTDHVGAMLRELGCRLVVHDNPVADGPPLLVARRTEGGDLPTVLLYGHGDVVNGDDAAWTRGRGPWELTVEDDRWYGRGTADNKGQHCVNLGALRSVLTARGALGFNLVVLLETGEEIGSPGLREFCRTHRELLEADLLVASDGPRFAAARPTVFLGSRGAGHFTLRVERGGGMRHSGNWGGLLPNPATILANALATLVDGRGRILVDGLRTPPIGLDVRRALADLTPSRDPDDPEVDPTWGEPELTPTERLLAGNTLEILAMGAADPSAPVSALPDRAEAHCQLRFVVGTDLEALPGILRRHLDQRGFPMVEVVPTASGDASRTDLADPWVEWTRASLRRSSVDPLVIPNFGGTLPNAVFREDLGLPTVWIPHSYPGCLQHAPDEHLLGSIAREGLLLMTGLFWDLGSPAVRRPGFPATDLLQRGAHV